MAEDRPVPLALSLWPGEKGAPASGQRRLSFAAVMWPQPHQSPCPAYTFRGTNPPAAGSCGPRSLLLCGARHHQDNGKYVAPGAQLRGRPATKTTVTPGPSDYRTEAANRHVFKCPPVQSMAFAGAPPDRPPSRSWHLHAAQADGAQHSLHIGQPLLLCEGKEPARSLFDEDLAKTPGPAALPKVPVDAYKTRARVHDGSPTKSWRGQSSEARPADYSVGRVTLIKPQAPASTFGIRHSLYTTPLIVE
eukprot:XP_024997893.1 outer dense fiber protein 3-like [Gallus gallus]